MPLRLQAEAAPRLDVWLAGRPEVGLSRAQIQRLIGTGGVRVDGQAVRAAAALHGTEIIDVDLPEVTPAEAVPQDIPLDVVYEDGDIIVINKPRGLVVHPAPGHQRGTLVNALLYHCHGQLAETQGESVRPGIVHRLDKDTTGLLVAAKTEPAAAGLQRAIANRRVRRLYLALVHGKPPERFEVDLPIGRDPRNRQRMAVLPPGSSGRVRSALTRFVRLKSFGEHSLLRAQLATGRTHQVRVHLSFAGHPIVGDPVYGRPHLDELQGFGLRGQALHAVRLEFEHPITGRQMELEAPVPADFQTALDALEAGERGMAAAEHRHLL